MLWTSPASGQMMPGAGGTASPTASLWWGRRRPRLSACLPSPPCEPPPAPEAVSQHRLKSRPKSLHIARRASLPPCAAGCVCSDTLLVPACPQVSPPPRPVSVCLCVCVMQGRRLSCRGKRKGLLRQRAAESGEGPGAGPGASQKGLGLRASSPSSFRDGGRGCPAFPHASGFSESGPCRDSAARGMFSPLSCKEEMGLEPQALH